MSVTETKRKEIIDEDEIEIRLSDIVQFLKVSRWRILLGALIGLVIGGVYAFNKPNQYSSQVTVMPEIQAKGGSLGGLGSLAGLAGIDISGATGGSMDAIRPDIYPDILQSVPFGLQLLKQPVYSKLLAKETSLQTFFEEQGKRSLLGGIIRPGDNETAAPTADPENRSKTLQITKKQEGLIKQIHSTVVATYDKKTGMITVSATLPDPVVAATVARLSLEYLTDYITSYRTEKTRNQVRFLLNQVNDAKRRYQMAEYALSNYRDQNRSLFLNTAKIEEQRLQADFLLTQTVFNDLSKQLEQAKVKVAEESPIFKVLEPAQVPLTKSGPNRSLIIVGFMVVGVFVGLFISGLRRFIFNLEN